MRLNSVSSGSCKTSSRLGVAAVFLIGWWVAAVAAEENDCRSQYKLSDTPPPHDYGKTLLLWASTRWPQLLDESRSSKIVDHILGLQQEDGGWSIHRFAKPEEWGDGLRAEKLRSEPDFESAPSDGHMTGLAVITLLDAGVPAEDPQIQKGVEWLKKNQRESGRWWTRSLNTDSFHFITFSSTLYALVSLDKSGALVQ